MFVVCDAATRAPLGTPDLKATFLLTLRATVRTVQSVPGDGLNFR